MSRTTGSSGAGAPGSAAVYSGRRSATAVRMAPRLTRGLTAGCPGRSGGGHCCACLGSRGIRSTTVLQTLRCVSPTGAVVSGACARGWPREFGRVLRRTHDDVRPVPGEGDRYVARGSVLGDVGQAGHVTGHQLLADRAVQNLDDLVRLHGSVSPSQRSCSASPTMMPSGPRM